MYADGAILLENTACPNNTISGQTITVTGKTTVTFFGWTNTGADNIAAFGYELNGKAAFWPTNTTVDVTTLYDGVVAAGSCENSIAPDLGLSAHFAYAKRQMVEINVADLVDGENTVRILVKLTDGTIAALAQWGTNTLVK